MKTLKIALALFALIAGYTHLRADAVPVYHYYNSSNNDHYYTDNYSTLGSGAYGWSYVNAYFYISNTSTLGGSGTIKNAFYEYLNVDRHFYTTNYSRLGSGAAGWSLYRTVGYLWSTSFTASFNGNYVSQMLQRYINSTSGTYYYTGAGMGVPSGMVLDNSVYSSDEGYLAFYGLSGTPPYATYTEN